MILPRSFSLLLSFIRFNDCTNTSLVKGTYDAEAVEKSLSFPAEKSSSSIGGDGWKAGGDQQSSKP